jgi:hypothetical protein
VFEGKAIVFEGPEDYHHRIEDPDLGVEEQSVLIIRNCGPVGYPGSAEVVNMQPPAALMKRGVMTLPTMGDGRQSGTSGSPSILNVSPEAAAGGGLALLKTGDRIRIDLNTRKVDVLLPAGELEKRAPRLDAAEAGQHDAVGGDLSLHGRAVGHRRVPGAACDAVSQRDRDARRVAQQPLTHSVCTDQGEPISRAPGRREDDQTDPCGATARRSAAPYAGRSPVEYENPRSACRPTRTFRSPPAGDFGRGSF